MRFLSKSKFWSSVKFSPKIITWNWFPTLLVSIVDFRVSAVVSESFRKRISVDFQLRDCLVLVRCDCNELRLPKRE
jgi:hypothetical protein